MDGEGREEKGMFLYALGAIIWIGTAWMIFRLTGWGPSDPAYWGLIILASPASLVLAAFTLGKKKKE